MPINFMNSSGSSRPQEQRSRRAPFFYTSIWTIAQVIATIAVVSMEWHSPCDQKLVLWLIVAMIRNLVRLCLTVVGWKRAQEESAGTRFFPAEDTLVLDKMKEVWIQDRKIYMH